MNLRQIQAVIDAMEPRLRAAFIASIRDIRSEAQIRIIVGHLEAGDIESAIRALNLRPEFFAPLDAAVREAYYSGGVAAVAALPRIADPFPVAASSSGLTVATSGLKVG